MSQAGNRLTGTNRTKEALIKVVHIQPNTPLTMTRDTSSISRSPTMDAMLRQEAVYFHRPGVTNNNSNIIDQLLPCLENIREVCRLRHHDTLVIATSYLSRYLQSNTTTTTNTTHSMSRVALVCLYMACKIHEPAALPLRTLSDLHQRFFPQATFETTASWEQLELKVCEALAWRLNPPMASGFVDQLLLLQAQKVEEQGLRQLRRKAMACLETVFQAQPRNYVEQHKASDLAKAALVLGGVNYFDDDADPKALAFLKEWRRDTPRVNNTPSTYVSPPVSKKRCVTPTPPSEPARKRTKSVEQSSRKRTKLTCVHNISTSNRSPIPCLLWTGSPRLAPTRKVTLLTRPSTKRRSLRDCLHDVC